jgi:hypothetical protein
MPQTSFLCDIIPTCLSTPIPSVEAQRIVIFGQSIILKIVYESTISSIKFQWGWILVFSFFFSSLFISKISIFKKTAVIMLKHTDIQKQK